RVFFEVRTSVLVDYGIYSVEGQLRRVRSEDPHEVPAKPYSDKLGKDGKLTPEERQRRFANNLCLFCGGAGHSASACPKKTSSASKARAAKATPAQDPAPAAAPAAKESKN
ncbi:hypothetical protein OH77DRAFT_1525693, partial [Trametes cingulata]